MVINIDDYVWRWQNEYIIYHMQHLQQNGDLDKAESVFEPIYNKAINRMQDDQSQSQIDSITYQMMMKGQQVAPAVELFSQLENGKILDDLMDQIANSINSGIEAEYAATPSLGTFDQVLQQVQDQKEWFLTGNKMEASQIDKFFNSLLTAMRQATGGKLDRRIFEALTGLGQSLTGDSNYKVSSKWFGQVVGLSQEDLNMTDEILALLNKAVGQFNNGTLTKSSFNSIINNIFQRIIGERISQRLLQKGLQRAASEIDQIVVGSIKEGKNIKVSINDDTPFTLGGTKSNSKVDIFNSDAFQVSVTENDDSFNIEIGANTQVKWHSSKDSRIQLVGGASLGDCLSLMDGPAKYLSYNLIAHRWAGAEFAEVYSKMRATIAASFFNSWLSGDTSITNSQINKVQFLMINGKVYSVMRIIRNICNELASNEKWDSPFKMSIAKITGNKWLGEGPNRELAIQRSQATKEIINKLTISATLNSKILEKYAY